MRNQKIPGGMVQLKHPRYVHKSMYSLYEEETGKKCTETWDDLSCHLTQDFLKWTNIKINELYEIKFKEENI